MPSVETQVRLLHQLFGPFAAPTTGPMSDASRATSDATHPLLRALPPSHGADRRHGDVAGVDLDELVRRLDGEPIAFSLTTDRTWSAMSYTGEYSAHADTLDDVVDELLRQLPVVPA